MRFHLDENVDHAIAYGLQRHGIDVTVSSEVGLLGAPDEEQLAFTLGQQRVMVTHDRDMLRLARRGVPHAGLAYIHAEDARLGEMIQALLLMWGVMEPDEMMNHIEFL